MFGVFMVIWFLTRHLAYLAVCYSIFRDYLNVVTFGCFKGSNANCSGPFPPPEGHGYLLMPFVDPEGLACQTKTTTALFVFMLLFLQGLLVIWFGMIIGVAYRVLSGKGAEDSRSDDEGDDEEDEVDEKEDELPAHATHKPLKFIEVSALIEEEVGVEDLSPSNGKLSRPGRRYKKSGGASSGVTLPHDRKELLGRIGCDKGSS